MKKDEKKLIHKAIDGDLNKTETKRFRMKIKTDGHARAEYEELKKVVQETTRIRMAVPKNFTQRVLDQTRNQLPRK
jgi:anti-sigma factor RsiW